MPNQKISELTAIVTVDTSLDVLPIVDTSANTTKKISPTALKTALALDNVNNTSDANKPVSTAQQDALNAKVTGNTAIVAATKTKVTYDAKGLVTAGDILDAADIPTGINAANIGTGVVSSTEFGYLDGVTSAIQTQIDSKQATLVSATNIKTINSTSLLGSGDISISANPSGVSGAIQFSDGSAFASDATNLFWDDTNNRLGIGLNNPSARVDIKGVGTTSATTALSVANSAGTLALQVLDDSRVVLGNSSDFAVYSGSAITARYAMSVGTTSLPTATLQVKGSGSTSATTSLLVQNSAGTSSLQVTDDGSVYNLGKGSISTNTVFGRASFGANITGSENVAIGFDVLNANTSGQLNTAVGNSSLKANTNGIENVAVGVFALGNNTGGNANVAVGRSALGGNLTGSNNCAIGFDTQTGNFSSSVILGRSATATASNQFVVGSTAHNAGAVNSTTDVPATFLWSVRINGTNYKILMTT